MYFSVYKSMLHCGNCDKKLPVTVSCFTDAAETTELQQSVKKKWRCMALGGAMALSGIKCHRATAEEGTLREKAH